MDKKTLEQLESAMGAVERDLSARVEELAGKSTAGRLSAEECVEYEEIVRMNDLLGLLRLQAEQYWAPRAAS